MVEKKIVLHRRGGDDFALNLVLHRWRWQCSKEHYLGETQHFFPTRKYQHQYAVKCNQKTNGIVQHIHNNKKHTIHWDNQKFLDFESHWRKRKIKEALFIDSMNPGSDILPNKLMNLEKGIEISSCWKEFNPHIRRIFSKKIQRSEVKQKK